MHIPPPRPGLARRHVPPHAWLRIASAAAQGIASLGAAMAIAFIVVLSFGTGQALAVFAQPTLLLAAVGVGLCSSVIPYMCDQLAMARLPRASFALMRTLLPASATIIGGVALHRPAR